MKRSLVLVVVASVALVGACTSPSGQSGSPTVPSSISPAASSPMGSSSSAAGATAVPSPSTSPAPSPAVTESAASLALPLTKQQLQAALLTPKDLGSTWRVKARTLKPASAKQMRSYSPECQDFVREFAKPVTKNDLDTVYVDMNTGQNFGDRSLTERIEPLPDDGWEKYRNDQLALIDGCPQIVSPSTGANSLSATIQITPLNVDGIPDGSVGFLMNANAIIASYYIMSATVPVGENLVTIQSSWAQKSKKTLEKYVRKAAAKLQAVPVEASTTTTTAAPSPAP